MFANKKNRIFKLWFQGERKMKQVSKKIAMVLFIISLLMPSFALAQESDKERKRREKQEKQEAKRNKKDAKRIKKAVDKYEAARTKAIAKYEKDPEFAEDVEFTYRQVRRSHTDIAYQMNTMDSKDEVVTNSGDKLPQADSLYDNLLAQDYVNRVGQSLVPKSSNNRYGFKVTHNPIPDARSLSTGTVYVSTGLLSLVDNEAQLAYVLSHEIAHIEKVHWREDVMVAKWIEQDTKKKEKRASIFGAIAGGVVGGLVGGDAFSTLGGAFIGAGVGQFVNKLVNRNSFEWSLAQEDEADKLAMEYMLNRNYDVRETQTFYETLESAAAESPRIELSPFAKHERTENRRRTANAIIQLADTNQLANSLIGATNLRGKALSIDRNSTAVVNRLKKNETAMSADIKAKIESGELMAGDGEFENIMATLKRDNGIVAFYYDMYKLSARNLRQSLAIRSDDSLGYFYYGKVLKLTARKPGEKQQALQMFAKAIEYDKRGANPRARLYYALTKMSGRTTNNIQSISADLKEYVTLYQRMHGGALPPNMNIIYDYLQEAGETDWSATPLVNVKTVSRP